MPIEFPCPTCRHLVRTPDATAGKKGKCPQCGAVVQIPGPQSPAPAVIKIREAPSSSTPTLKDATSYITPNTLNSGTIDFSCAECGQVVRAPAALAGRRGRCPECGSITQIPQVGQGMDFGVPGSGAETPDSAIAGYLGPRLPAAKTSAWKVTPSEGLIPLGGRGGGNAELIPLHGGAPVGKAHLHPPSDPLANVAPVSEEELVNLERAPIANPYTAPPQANVGWWPPSRRSGWLVAVVVLLVVAAIGSLGAILMLAYSTANTSG